ncbi:MAG: hypothetical protein J6334_04665 [Kiritimatiellae bacterium]|nr:hypothetical protein [Kiritimatiellia bacterium]
MKQILAASLFFLAMDVSATLFWWSNPEVIKTVTLASSTQNLQSIICDAAGVYLAVSTSNGDIAAYSLPNLIRRKGGVMALGGNTLAAVNFSDDYLIGGKRLRYLGKPDGKVYVAENETEAPLIDLSGSSVIQARIAYRDTEAPFLHLLTNGSILIYRLAANGLSLSTPDPIARIDVNGLLDNGGVSCFEVSPDGLALFAVPEQGDSMKVIRSADWGLVDCVAYNASAETFPWRDAKPQTPTPNNAGISPLTIPPESSTFEAPFIWPWAVDTVYRMIGWSTRDIVSTFSSFTPGDAYQAEYHFAENWFGAVGNRAYDLIINGEVKFEDFDSVAASGIANRKAVALSYDTTADAEGKIIFTLAKKIDNPIYCGFAVKGREAPSALQFGTDFARDGSTGTLTWSARDALAYYVQMALTSEGPWVTILHDQTAKTLSVSPGTESSVYYRVVASNGVGMVASVARCNKSDTYTVYAVNCGFDTKRYGRFAPDDHHVDIGTIYLRDDNLLGKTPVISAGNEHAVPPEIAQTAIFYPKEIQKEMEYRFPNLNPAKRYDVRIYCLESYFNAAGSRVFSVLANDVVACSGIDAYAKAGEKFALAEYVCPDLSPAEDGTLTLTFAKEISDPDISAIEIVEKASPRVPLVPVVHGVFARNNGAQVCIGSGTGELVYDVRRRSAAGGVYETLVTGLSDYAWIDVGVTEGYLYSVRAVDIDGATGPWSEDVAITPIGGGPQPFLGISPQRNVTFSNGNGIYVPYSNYLKFNMGINEAAQSYSHDIVLDPAPDNLYTRILWAGRTEFNFTNLYPSASYRIRLQALESYYDAAGRRVSAGVYANEGQIWGAFDAYREVGKGVFPIEGIAKATPEGKINFFNTQSRDNIDFCTVELFLLDSSTENGIARAVCSGPADKRVWTQDIVSTLDLTDLPEGVPATGNTVIWDTMIALPADGSYAFDVEQGGDYALWIDDDIVLDAHGGASANATVTLGMGDHHLRARFVQGAGAASATVKWAGPGFARQNIAAASFTQSRTVDLSQDTWLLAEIDTEHAGDLYKTGHQTADGSDVWRMNASSVGIFGSNDKSLFAYREIKALAFEARVRLRNIPDRNRDSTFALTLRTGLTPFGGDYVYQMIGGSTTPGVGTRWHVGPQGADFTVNNPFIGNNVNWDVKLPIWMRVRKWREDDGRDLAEFSYSLDAEDPTWTVSVTNELTATRPIYVGVEACSYTTERLVSFEFDHFELDLPPPLGTLIIIN